MFIPYVQKNLIAVTGTLYWVIKQICYQILYKTTTIKTACKPTRSDKILVTFGFIHEGGGITLWKWSSGCRATWITSRKPIAGCKFCYWDHGYSCMEADVTRVRGNSQLVRFTLLVTLGGGGGVYTKPHCLSFYSKPSYLQLVFFTCTRCTLIMLCHLFLCAQPIVKPVTECKSCTVQQGPAEIQTKGRLTGLSIHWYTLVQPPRWISSTRYQLQLLAIVFPAGTTQ